MAQTYREVNPFGDTVLVAKLQLFENLLVFSYFTDSAKKKKKKILADLKKPKKGQSFLIAVKQEKQPMVLQQVKGNI